MRDAAYGQNGQEKLTVKNPVAWDKCEYLEFICRVSPRRYPTCKQNRMYRS